MSLAVLEAEARWCVVAAMECTGGETKEGKAATAEAEAEAEAAAAGYSYCVFLQCFRTATTMCSE